MTSADNKNNLHKLSTAQYEDRVVIFIDIIGFKNFVNNYDVAIIKEFFSAFEKLVSEGTMSVTDKGITYEPSATFFSDTIIISLPPIDLLQKSEGFINWTLLHVIHGLISYVQLYALKFNLLTRGCVTYDKIFHSSYTWFGPAIIDAHIHETEYAIYPRVILSPKLVTLLKAEIDGSYKQDMGPLHYADDGFHFINFLGPMIRSTFGYDDIKSHQTIREIIEKNLNDQSLPEKAKIKWRWLAYYFNDYTTTLLKAHGDKIKLIDT